MLTIYDSGQTVSVWRRDLHIESRVNDFLLSRHLIPTPHNKCHESSRIYVQRVGTLWRTFTGEAWGLELWHLRAYKVHLTRLVLKLHAAYDQVQARLLKVMNAVFCPKIERGSTTYHKH